MSNFTVAYGVGIPSRPPFDTTPVPAPYDTIPSIGIKDLEVYEYRLAPEDRQLILKLLKKINKLLAKLGGGEQP